MYSLLNRHVYCVIFIVLFCLWWFSFYIIWYYSDYVCTCIFLCNVVCVGYVIQEVPVAWPLLTSMHGLFGCMVAPLSGVMTWWPCMSVDLFIHVSMLSVGLSVRTSAPIQQAARKLQTGCRHCVCCHRYLIFPTIVVKTQAWLS